MLFHFRIRGLSGIIESVVPCSHGQTLNRTVVDLHRHQLRFFLAALEHKGEDQHDCHKHEAEHIAVARTVHEALRGIGTATGRIAGLAQAQQAGGHSGGDGARTTCCMVLRMVLPSAAMRPGNDLSAADCADC